jgi:hypothetical protein
MAAPVAGLFPVPVVDFPGAGCFAGCFAAPVFLVVDDLDATLAEPSSSLHQE